MLEELGCQRTPSLFTFLPRKGLGFQVRGSSTPRNSESVNRDVSYCHTRSGVCWGVAGVVLPLAPALGVLSIAQAPHQTPSIRRGRPVRPPADTRGLYGIQKRALHLGSVSWGSNLSSAVLNICLIQTCLSFSFCSRGSVKVSTVCKSVVEKETNHPNSRQIGNE